MKQTLQRNHTNQVIYQIYPKSFLDTTGSGIGDINGIRRKLDYLANLGVDYLWLSPINCSPQYDNGYDISDYDNIDPMFGSNEDYASLIQEARCRNMKVMMDLVLNHTSDAHVWFQKAKQNDPKYKNYYIFRKQPNELQSVFGNSAWTYCEELGEYYLHFFDVHQPDLNWENPEVREELYAMINRWMEWGVEGFRLDVIDMIGKEPDRLIGAKGPKFYDYLKELNNQTFKDRLLTVGECWGATFEDVNRMCGSDGLTQVFHFHQLTTTNIDYNKWNQAPFCLSKLVDVMLPWQNEFEGVEAVVMNNHDSPRLLSLWLNDEQYRKESAMLLIMLFGLFQGNLYVYQGEEIGMTNAHFKDIRQYNDVETRNKYAELKQTVNTLQIDETVNADVWKLQGMDTQRMEKQILNVIAKVSRDNARTPMQWDATKAAGFTFGQPWLEVNPNYDVVNAEADLNSNHSIYRMYQSIIAYRKTNADALKETLSLIVVGEGSDVLQLRKGNLTGYYNFSKETRVISCTGLYGEAILFHNYADETSFIQNSVSEIVLRPYEAVVFQK